MKGRQAIHPAWQQGHVVGCQCGERIELPTTFELDLVNDDVRARVFVRARCTLVADVHAASILCTNCVRVVVVCACVGTDDDGEDH